MSRLIGSHTLISCSLTALILTSVPLVPALAQTPTQNAVTFTFAVPQSSLESVLTEIGRVGKVTVSVPSDLVAGRSAGPVMGSDTVQGALARALAGSGLVAELKPDGTFVIRKQSAGLQGDVPSVEVEAPTKPKPTQARAATAPAEAATPVAPSKPNGDVGYVAGNTGNIAGIQNMKVKEIPLAIGVVTQDMMQTQQAGRTADLARNVAGVMLTGDGGLKIRGFNTTDKGIVVDGFKRIPANSEMYERVEVLKGATSIFTGLSKDGGVVNFVTKQADGQTHNDIMTRYDSFYGATSSIDWGGKVPGASGYSMRFVAAGNYDWLNLNGPGNDGRRRELSVAPSITFKNDVYEHSLLFTSTEAYVPQGTSYAVQFDSVARKGLSGEPLKWKPGNIPGPVPWGGENNSYGLTDTQTIKLGEIAGTKVSLNNRFFLGQFQFSYNRLQANQVARSGWPSARGPYSLWDPVVGALASPGIVKSMSEKVDLTFETKTDLLINTLQVGVNGGWGENKTLTPFFNSNLTSPPSSIYTLNNYSSTRTKGSFLANKTDLFNNSLHIFGSVRKDWWETSSFSYTYTSPNDPFFFPIPGFPNVPSQTPEKSREEQGVSWTAGGVYDITKWMSVFLNAGHGIQPGSTLFSRNPALNGGLTPPLINDQKETGLRFTLPSGMILSVTGYDQTKTNIPATDPITRETTIISSQSSTGVELQAQGAITKQLQAVVALSRANVKYGAFSNTASAVAGTPGWTGTIWGVYTFEESSMFKGFFVGSGLRGHSSTMAITPNSKPIFDVSGYVVADAMLGYKYQDWTITGRVTNIFDKLAFQPTNSTALLIPEQPRTFTLEARTKF